VEVPGRIERTRDRAVQTAQDAYRRWPLLEFPIELVRRWIRVNASVLAGHLAFRIFLFIVPLLLVIVAGLGWATSNGVDLEEQGNNVRMGRALAASLASAGEQSEQSHLRVGLIAVVALVTTTSGLVAALRLVVAAVWELPVKAAPRSKVTTMAWLLPGVLVILAGAALKQWFTRRGLVLDGLGVAVSITINAVCLLGLFWILPRRATRLVDLVPGTLAAAVGFAGLNIATAVYFTDKLQQSSQVYGALGVAVTSLAYLFIIGQIIVIATIVNTIWLDREQILHEVRSQDRAGPLTDPSPGPTPEG
jgi:membrane protein